MLVKEFMTKDVVTITEDKNMLEVRELMRNKDKRRLPVVDDINRVRGIITDADVSRTSPTDATTLSRYEANYLLGKLKVRDVMTKNVITVHQDSGVEDAAYLLYKNKINALPVVDDENKLCGIITDSDIFRAFVDIMALLILWAWHAPAPALPSTLPINRALSPISAPCSVTTASTSSALLPNRKPTLKPSLPFAPSWAARGLKLSSSCASTM